MKSFRVLIICDDEEGASSWYTILRPLGLHLDGVSTCQILGSPVMAVGHDIVIIDTGDQQNNVAVCHVLRPIFGGAILLFADGSDEKHLMAGYAVGADECIAKTLGSRILQAKVRSWCRRLDRFSESSDGLG